MQKITFLVLVLSAFVLTACFRSAGDDPPTAQPVSLSDEGLTQVADVPTQETLPSETPTQEVAVQASPSETDIPPSSTPTATATLPESGGGGEAIPPVEITDTASPTVEVVIQPTDTATATATHTATATATVTATATHTLTPTATATASATLTPTNTNTPVPVGPSPTLTTIPLQIGFQNTSNGAIPPAGQGGQLAPPSATTVGVQGQQAEVAQAITPTTDPLAAPTAEQQPGIISPNQQTATAVIQGATQTQAAAETLAAGGDPNAAQQQPQQQGVTPGAGGQTIIITATPVGQAADCEYMVQIGDNLGSIARTYNTTINDLAVKNSITNPDLIRAGYPIIIPGCGQITTTPSNITPTATIPVAGSGGAGAINNATGPFIYTVQAGDNIYRLSLTYGVTMREILAANPQVSNMNVITEGQQITIPGPPTQTTTTQAAVTPAGNVVIVTATATPVVPAAGAGGAAPTAVQPQVVPPTAAQPVVPAFTPSFTPSGAQG